MMIRLPGSLALSNVSVDLRKLLVQEIDEATRKRTARGVPMRQAQREDQRVKDIGCPSAVQ